MITIIAHASPGESTIAAVVHATGGLHYLLGLVAAGLAATRHGRRATPIALFVAALAVGGTLGAFGSAAGSGLVGPLAAVAAGVAVAASTRTPLWLVQSVMIVFGGCYGLLQGHHLTHHSDDGLNTLAGMLVVTTGAYLLGAITTTIADETGTRTPVTVALGAATAATAAIPLTPL